MEQKQVLKVSSCYSNSIIKLSNQPNLNINDWFTSKEGEKMSSYPVRIVALSVGWLYNNPEGLEYLQAIDDSQNMELLTIPTLQMVIELFYSKFKSFLFTKLIRIYFF